MDFFKAIWEIFFLFINKDNVYRLVIGIWFKTPKIAKKYFWKNQLKDCCFFTLRPSYDNLHITKKKKCLVKIYIIWTNESI